MDPIGLRQRFRARLNQPGALLAPGAYNALTARQIQDAGFEVAYATGAGIANSYLGYADLGLQGLADLVTIVRQMVLAIDIPLIADIDTGFGNVLNVTRAIREFEQAGVCGVHIEDQEFPKRCGHFAGKSVVSKKEMVGKLRAALDARRDSNLLIIARTDARAVNGMTDALERAAAYAEAGADAIFLEAPESLEELRMAARCAPVPQVANMVEGGKTPVLDVSELEEMGFKIILYANALLRAAMKAGQDILRILHTKGTTRDHYDLIVTWEERQRVVRMSELESILQRFGGQ